MKVIELLNKIANGEIHYSRKFRFPYGEYCTATQFFERYIVDKDSLNMEIKELEDTEDTEDKKIEKLDYLNSDYYYKNNTYGTISSEEIVLDIKTIENYINKLVDRLNGDE